MTTDPIDRGGESIPEADARYALTDAMSAAYAEEFALWRARYTNYAPVRQPYDILRNEVLKAEGCPWDGFLLLDQYRERASMGAALLIAQRPSE